MKKSLILLTIFLLFLTACSKQSPESAAEGQPEKSAVPSSPEESPGANQSANDTPESSSPSSAAPSPESLQVGETPITVSFAGDTMMAGKVADIVKTKGFDYPFTDAAPIFQKSELTILNLETAISHRGQAKEKEYTFRSDPLMAKALKEAGVDVVTIANNHALDYGTEAFIDTMEFLSKEGVSYVGGGRDQEEAYAPFIKYLYGKKISIFGFSRVLAEASWHAGVNHPGMASAYNHETVYQAVATEAERSDYSIVYIHWGKELAEQPLPYQVELAHGLIDRGVDLVIGSHPHVLQGLEWYKGKLIAYSLGNFVFTTSRVAEGRQSGILQVTLKGDQIIPRFIPMFIDRGAVWLADEAMSETIMERLKRLSRGGTWNEHNEYFPAES